VSSLGPTKQRSSGSRPQRSPLFQQTFRWEHFTYNTHFYGRVLRLKIESKIVQDKIDAKKGTMGLTIYDSFEQEDTAGAEVKNIGLNQCIDSEAYFPSTGDQTHLFRFHSS
jgi:hypothetical protein